MHVHTFTEMKFSCSNHWYTLAPSSAIGKSPSSHKFHLSRYIHFETMGKKSRRKKRDKAEQLEFEIDNRVTLKDLKATQYNGKHGTIVSLPDDPKDPDQRFGVRVDGSNEPIGIKAVNMEMANILDPNVQAGMSTEQKLRLRKEAEDRITLTNEEAMNADEMMMMRMMSSMFLSSEESQIKVFGRRIAPMPNFWMELKKEGYPHGIVKQWADQYLRTAFEQAHGLPHLMEMRIKMGNYEASPKDWIKRIGIPDKDKLDWFLNQPRRRGDIFPRDNTISAYSPFIRHSFSNQAYRKEVLHKGTTHVAVGFVDLGVLFAATLQGPPSPRYQGQSLHFLGIDMSSYAVAKSLVIWEMLQQTPVGSNDGQRHCRAIAQAWFSATWSDGTEKVVKAAIDRLHKKPPNNFPDDVQVACILNHWKGASSTSLKNARQQWSSHTSCARSSIGYLERKIDRVAMAKYELSGDFALEGPPVSGNMLMFDCPEGTEPPASDETVFSALDWKDVADLLTPRKTILQAAEEFALNNVSKVANWARNDLVTVSLVCAKVEDKVDLITGARPWTMSWSNVLDYMSPSEFHRLARRCSVHGDTIHFGYSMNWVIDVFGTNIIDFQGQPPQARKEIVDVSNENVERSYKMLGWDRYLRLPPPCNPINTTSNYCLEMIHYKDWAKHFFNFGRRDGPCSVAHVEHTVGSPLSPTGGSTVAFTWTYHPDIRFNTMEQKIATNMNHVMLAEYLRYLGSFR